MEDEAPFPPAACGLLVNVSEDDIEWLMSSPVFGPELREHLENCQECRLAVPELIHK